MDVDEQTEQTRSRLTHRRVSVLEKITGIDSGWVGVQSLIRVERSGMRGQQPFTETVFYISSLRLDAASFAERIRHHWQIENRLHWPKDAVLKEDESPLCDGHAAANFTIVRSMVINLFRHHGFASITKALRHLSHDVHRLFSFFQ